MPVSLSLPELMAALKDHLWSEHGVIPRVSTLDGVHYQCIAVEADDPTQQHEGFPTGVGHAPGTAERDAVEEFIRGLGYALPWEAGGTTVERASALKTLADLCVAGLVFGLDGSVVDVASGEDVTPVAIEDDNLAPERPLAVGDGR